MLLRLRASFASLRPCSRPSLGDIFQFALAHSTSKLSLVAFPETSSPADDGQEASRPALEIVQQFATTSTLKASNKTLSLDFLPSYVFSIKSRRLSEIG